MEENGIMSENDYPSNEDGTCHFNKSDIVTKISSYKFITPDNEDELQKAVATVGPIAAVIQVRESFQFYSSGELHKQKFFKVQIIVSLMHFQEFWTIQTATHES